MKRLRPAVPEHTANHKSVNEQLARTTRPRLSSGPWAVRTGKESHAAEGRKIRVLVVEDDKAVAESTRRLLELKAFLVDCAFDGASALAMAQSQSYDVVLLDRRLPDSSGDEVIERLRGSENSTPIVMITAFPDYESALHAGRFNVSDYLVKTDVTGATLAASIRKAATQIVGPGPIKAEPKTRIFLAYGGKISRSFSDLVAHVRSDEVNPSELSRQLARTISARDLTFAEFLSASKSLDLLIRKAHLPLHVVLSTLRVWLDPDFTGLMLNSRVEDILARLEAAGPNWAEISEEDLAVELHLNRTTVWRCIADEIGVTFPALRRAIVIRRAVLLLAETREHVRQIAFQIGYDDPGRLDKDFDAVLNLTPTHFRRLCD